MQIWYWSHLFILCKTRKNKREKEPFHLSRSAYSALSLNVNHQHQEWEGKPKGKSIILKMLSVYYWKMKSLIWYGLWEIISHSLLLCIWKRCSLNDFDVSVVLLVVIFTFLQSDLCSPHLFCFQMPKYYGRFAFFNSVLCSAWLTSFGASRDKMLQYT